MKKEFILIGIIGMFLLVDISSASAVKIDNTDNKEMNTSSMSGEDSYVEIPLESTEDYGGCDADIVAFQIYN